MGREWVRLWRYRSIGDWRVHSGMGGTQRLGEGNGGAIGKS